MTDMTLGDWIIHTIVPPGQRNQPPREPAIVDPDAKPQHVNVTYGDPDCGWLDLTVEVGKQKTTTRFSQCWDPLPDLIKWLECLVKGEQFGTAILDCEGWYSAIMFDVGPTSETVTFGLNDCWFSEMAQVETQIITLAKRRQLVRAFYEPLAALWRPDDDEFWKSWFYSYDPEHPDETGPRYEVRRESIDTYLRTVQ